MGTTLVLGLEEGEKEEHPQVPVEPHRRCSAGRVQTLMRLPSQSGANRDKIEGDQIEESFNCHSEKLELGKR